MNNSAISGQNRNYTQSFNTLFYRNLSLSQFIGILVATIAFLLIIGVIIFLIICQKHRLRLQKLRNQGITSNNPCYVGSSMSQFDKGDGHCNMTVSTDFYDIDDLTSLDNDSFLNSLENAIFVGYLNHGRPTVSERLSDSIVHSNQTVLNQRTQNPQNPNANSSSHSYSKSTPVRHQSSDSSVKLRTGKPKRSMAAVEGVQDSTRVRAKSETISESIGSTSNLITSSKMFLGDSNDSFCDSRRDSNHLGGTSAARSMETNVDAKAESSTDSHASVNSGSAMMSSYTVDRKTANQALPDIVNISLPRPSKQLKRASSSYSNSLQRDEWALSSTGQILDPLRAGQNVHFISEFAQQSSGKRARHERNLSYNVGLSQSGLHEYNVPT